MLALNMRYIDLLALNMRYIDLLALNMGYINLALAFKEVPCTKLESAVFQLFCKQVNFMSA